MDVLRISLFLVLGMSVGVGAAIPRDVAAEPLPTVDLGYGVYQATVNETGAYYNFSNIRYAEPPVGDLRFAAPIPPQGRNSTVNDGQQSATCPQAAPEWLLEFEAEALGVNVSTLIAELENSTSTTSEDCLFLDVIVPEDLYNRGASGNSTGAPVLVWIYGGGYVLGSKAAGTTQDPAGLIAQSQVDGGEGIIYVALNYRLGIFGWLSGPAYQENATANTGLYDQRLALEWVQSNIHLFGGDPNRVTVMGESAGGGSIMHQITAYGGSKKVPFQQAIPQSPAWLPIGNDTTEDAIFETVLKYASYVTDSSITTLSQLRALPSAVMQDINALVILQSPYGQFTVGPAVDGDFVPALPGQLLLEGRFDQDLKVMVGHNLNESFLFTSPYITNSTAFNDFLQTYQLPTASAEVLTYVETVLYPPVFDGTYDYTTEVERMSLVIAESTFTCNTRYLDLAFDNATYAYFFTIPPGFHGEDVPYTFFNGDTTTSDDGLPVNATIAKAFQAYLTSFAMTGDPNGVGRPYFPMYGSNSTVLDIDIAFDGATQKDPVANSRCDWWQKALYV